MSLFKTSTKELFNQLFSAHTQDAVDQVITNNIQIFDQGNWFPLGGNENNYGVIENQQASPIAALIEKVTNSIDATLMKKCYEAGIDPKSPEAPKTMEIAREMFFPDYKKYHILFSYHISTIFGPHTGFQNV